MCRALGSSRTREKEPCDRVLSLPLVLPGRRLALAHTSAFQPILAHGPAMTWPSRWCLPCCPWTTHWQHCVLDALELARIYFVVSHLSPLRFTRPCTASRSFTGHAHLSATGARDKKIAVHDLPKLQPVLLAVSWSSTSWPVACPLSTRVACRCAPYLLSYRVPCPSASSSGMSTAWRSHLAVC